MKKTWAELRKKPAKPVPAGWSTIHEIRKEWGLSLSQTWIRLSQYRRDGTVEQKRWPNPDSLCGAWIVIYRPK